MVSKNKRVVKMSIYCKFRERSIEKNEYNKDCPCVSCSILKRCSIPTCEHQAMVFVYPDEYRNKMEQCKNCIQMSYKIKKTLKERVKEHTR